MNIEEKLMMRLKEGMRAKKSREVSAIRMIKTQAQAARTAPGFSGETDDAFWLDIITRYVKQQKKSRIEFENAGERGAEQVDDLTFEIEYFSEFLPKQLSPDEVRVIVKEAIAKTGASGTKMVGRIVGFVMKNHGKEVDAALAKSIAAEELG
jgi:uncharacterized protein